MNVLPMVRSMEGETAWVEKSEYGLSPVEISADFNGYRGGRRRVTEF
jgi:hypothetical protein